MCATATAAIETENRKAITSVETLGKQVDIVRQHYSEAAKEARVKLPALETVEEIYEMASEEGNSDLDYAATLMLLEKWAGVQVKGQAA